MPAADDWVRQKSHTKMKSLRVSGMAVLLPLFICLTPGCSTLPKVADAPGPRFHEANHANVVLRFASWNYIFLVHPEYREDGFYHQLKRDTVADTLKRFNGPHDMAVVTVGWGYKPEQLKEVVADWETILGGCGFRRVVVVRASFDYSIDGAVIVDDSLAAKPTTRDTAAL